MDNDERHRQQYGTPYQQGSSSRSGQPMGPPSSERFTHPSPSTSRGDLTRVPISRPFVPSYAGYGYQEPQYATPQTLSSSPMQGVEMQFHPGYGSESVRQSQMQSPHQYAAYGQNVMVPPGASQQVYETMPQYQQRQAAAVEVLTTQFGVPQYLPQPEHSSVALPVPQAQFMTTQAEQAVYGQQITTTRPAAASSYPSSGPQYGAVERPEEPDPQEAAAHQQNLNEGIRQCREQLKAAFALIKAVKLNDASQKITDLSRWLLSSVSALDLHHDKINEQQARLDLWREFNLCWEALGQKQKEVTEEALRTRQQPPDLLSATTMTTIVDELIKLCDQVDQHGLVDYEMGVWEEQIVHIFIQCLDLLPSEQSGTQGSSTQAGSSAAP